MYEDLLKLAKTPSPSSHSSQNSTYIIIFSKKKKVQLLTCFPFVPWKKTLHFLFVLDQVTPTKHWLHNEDWRDDLLERCIASKDAYNSYHYKCIEKQTSHTLNKLFIVKCKIKIWLHPSNKASVKVLLASSNIYSK